MVCVAQSLPLRLNPVRIGQTRQEVATVDLERGIDSRAPLACLRSRYLRMLRPGAAGEPFEQRATRARQRFERLDIEPNLDRTEPAKPGIGDQDMERPASPGLGFQRLPRRKRVTSKRLRAVAPGAPGQIASVITSRGTGFLRFMAR